MIKMHNRHTTGADRFVIAKDRTTANDGPQNATTHVKIDWMS